MKKISIAILLLSAFISCKKDKNDEPQKKCKVSEYIYDTGDTEVYSYDGNHITEVLYTLKSGKIYTYKFYYNNQDQIEKLEFLEDGTDIYHYREYSFDQKGNLIKDEQYNKSGNDFIKSMIIEYTYNAENQIISISTFEEENSKFALTDYDTIIYDGQNPVQKIDYDIANSKPANQKAISEFEHDKNINFLTINKEPYYFLASYLGANNIIKETRKQPGGAIFYEMIYEYEYNEWGYVTKISQIDTKAQDTTVTDVRYICE
jgi:hypothetical protein